MGRKGERGTLKRKPAPKLWPIHRKEAVWTVKPKPGPHPLSQSLPLILIVRDMLEFAKTGKEAKNIISQGKIMVDGKVRCDERFLVGPMDVISIGDAKKTFRVIPSRKGLVLHQIDSDEAAFKLCRIENKHVVKGGNTDLNLHDGSIFLLQADNSTNSPDTYHTLDIVKISVPDRELLDHTKMTVGAPAILISGKNMGKYGKIVDIEKKADKRRRDLLVTLKDANGDEFQTILDFVFILGDAEPSISLPEAN